MKVVFPGSFDPITLGHIDIIKRGAQFADTLYVLVNDSAAKKYMFDMQVRTAFVREALGAMSNVEVVAAEGLTVDFCKKVGATHILRGIRDAVDYTYEMGIAGANKKLADVETIFLLSDGNYNHISASIVRELIAFHANLDGFVPINVIKWIEANK